MSDPNNPNPPASPSPEHGNRGGNRPQASKAPGRGQFQAPKGTRDLYPDDANLRRFITEAWRNASIRHGFEEVDGPTFEDADLYKVKSGDGILAEMFGVFSGKSPEDVEAVRDPERGPPYALRPEFTPTLARMYAARAAQLGKPTKWFTAGPFFRAERPQRGRLREFLQWNVDFIGLPSLPEVAQACSLSTGAARSDQPAAPKVDRLSEPESLPPSTTPPAHDPLAESKARADAECIACCIELLRSLGLTSDEVKIRVSDRTVLESMIQKAFESTIGVEYSISDIFAFLDRLPKLSSEAAAEQAANLHLNLDYLTLIRKACESLLNHGIPRSVSTRKFADGHTLSVSFDYGPLQALLERIKEAGCADWCVIDLSIVRGLAYYTGMVFEVIADGERAVAGGGRYDNLIELFGGPPTPAVGFGMGDVVLTNLLRDKGLLPEGKTLLDKLSQPPASLRPDAFVLTADEALDPLVRQLVAELRRGAGTNRPLHARHSYKSTRNIGKLLKEAAAQHARIAVIIESDAAATVKPLDGGEQVRCPIAEVRARIAALLGR